MSRKDHEPAAVTADGLGSLSDAEWEYACRYSDHLALGEPAPDPSGYDDERTAKIRARLDHVWKEQVKAIRRRGK